MSKADARIYLKAAQIMENRETVAGCCKAIRLAELGEKSHYDPYGTPIQKRFAKIFDPNNGDSYWWGNEDWYNPRVVALCFAAAMAEAGDL